MGWLSALKAALFAIPKAIDLMERIAGGIEAMQIQRIEKEKREIKAKANEIIEQVKTANNNDELLRLARELNSL